MAKRKGLSFYKRKKKISHTLLMEIFSYIFIIFAATFFAFVLVITIGTKTSMIGVSMQPNLENGQELLIDKFTYKFSKPKQGDVVAFYPNGNDNTHCYIKRVIATPGDKIQIRSGEIYVNGEVYGKGQYDKIADAGIVESEILLGTDEFFVLGDNVNSSEDSRSSNIGAIKKNYIVGKIWFHMASDQNGMGFMK